MTRRSWFGWIGVLTCTLASLAACGDTARVDTARYHEPHRPTYHFTPPAMWMNDPNGLVVFEGEYHLFYQYFPDDKVWGPMHWGHAVSRDLVHWEHLPIALYPDEHGYIFSGSAVVDRDNTTGFGTDGRPPLVAVFTYHDPVKAAAGSDDQETQGLAYSNDRGRTWTKYAGNPVLPNAGRQRDFRDPSVFWHEPTRRWVMALSVSDHVQFWRSPDLRGWEYLSSFGDGRGAHGGTWECPNLFPMVVTETGETRWVLILNLNPGGPQGGSGTQYFVGDFDGTRFALDERFAATLDAQQAVWLDWGRDNYAGVTWSDVPADDGRRIFIGWMSNWDYAQSVPTDPWRSAMTLPRELTLRSTPEGYRVYSRPVREVERLASEAVKLPPVTLRGTADVSERIDFPVSASRILAEFSLRGETAATFGVLLSNSRGESYRIGFDAGRAEYFSDRRASGDHRYSTAFADRVHRAPRAVSGESVAMELYLDVASVELFADGGALAMTEIFFPSEPFDRLAFFADGGDVELKQATVMRIDAVR